MSKLDQGFAEPQARLDLLIGERLLKMLGRDVALLDQVIAQHQSAHFLLLLDGDFQLLLADDVLLDEQLADRVADLEVGDRVFWYEHARQMTRIPLEEQV